MLKKRFLVISSKRVMDSPVFDHSLYHFKYIFSTNSLFYVKIYQLDETKRRCKILRERGHTMGTKKVLLRIIKGAILISFILILTFLVQNFDIFNVDKILENLHEMAESNSVIIPFILITTLLLIFFVPISTLAGAAGLLFELRGIIYITIAGILAAVISYFLARVFKTDVEKMVEKYYLKKERELSLEEIYEKIKNHGFSYALFIRALPFMPFSTGNFLFGVSKISFMDYFTTTLITVGIGQGINVFLVAMAADFRQQKTGMVAAVILKGIYYYMIYYWSKKNNEHFTEKAET